MWNAIYKKWLLKGTSYTLWERLVVTIVLAVRAYFTTKTEKPGVENFDNLENAAAIFDSSTSLPSDYLSWLCGKNCEA